MAFLKLIIEIEIGMMLENLYHPYAVRIFIGTVSAIPEIIFVSDHIGHFQVHIAKLL